MPYAIRVLQAFVFDDPRTWLLAMQNGPERPRSRIDDRVFDLRLVLEGIGPGHLGLEQTTAAARIAHYAIRVAPFDRDALTNRLRELGTRVLPAQDEPDVVRFADDNGIVVELRVASAS